MGQVGKRRIIVVRKVVVETEGKIVYNMTPHPALILLHLTISSHTMSFI